MPKPANRRNWVTFSDIKIGPLKVPDTGTFKGLLTYWLVFICAVVVTFHVIFTGKFAVRNDIYLLTMIQLATVALLALSLMLFDRQPLKNIPFTSYLILIYLALFGTVYTFLMQTAMQRYTTATRTALVFSMEPVFAALFAYLLAAETMDSLGWLGGGLIFSGMIIAEVKWRKL
jgi:drug/metabolite transporter (DMT)-like permease